jgi:hypothetical protein
MKKRTAKIVDEGFRNTNLLAAALLTDARLYLKAAHALEDEQTIWSPRYFLLCHAIELILKSYLASHDASQKELKDLGHNMLKAYARARKRGLKPSDPRTTEIIRWLSPFHKDLVFRYRKSSAGFVRYPDPKELADVVGNLIGQIDPIVRERFRHRQTPISD